MALRPTEKQLRYALALMRENGYPTQYFTAKHKELGLSMRERQGRCEDMSLATACKIIDALKGK